MNAIFVKTRQQPVLTESSTWIDFAAPRMLRWAAYRAPEPLRERLAEEWQSHVGQLRGGTTRLRFMLGCLWAATMISYEGPLAGAVPVASVAPGLVPASGRPRRSAPYPQTPRASGSVMSEMNITPLIDVMLVLLVTLIISLPTMTHAVKLDVAHGAASPTAPPTVIDLDIDSDGSIVWNGTMLTGLQQLEGYLQAEAKADSQAEIHLRPERRTRYDIVAKVLAAAQRNHMDKLSFVGTTEFAN